MNRSIIVSSGNNATEIVTVNQSVSLQISFDFIEEAGIHLDTMSTEETKDRNAEDEEDEGEDDAEQPVQPEILQPPELNNEDLHAILLDLFGDTVPEGLEVPDTEMAAGDGVGESVNQKQHATNGSVNNNIALSGTSADWSNMILREVERRFPRIHGEGRFHIVASLVASRREHFQDTVDLEEFQRMFREVLLSYPPPSEVSGISQVESGTDNTGRRTQEQVPLCATASASASNVASKKRKAAPTTRGSYNCTLCGQLKAGHTCPYICKLCGKPTKTVTDAATQTDVKNLPNPRESIQYRHPKECDGLAATEGPTRGTGEANEASVEEANKEDVETVDGDKSNNNNMQAESKEDKESHAGDDKSRSEGVVEENRESGGGKDNNVAEDSKEEEKEEEEEQALDHQEKDEANQSSSDSEEDVKIHEV